MPNHVHLIAVPPMLERYADIGALLEEATQDDTGKIPVCAHSPRERRPSSRRHAKVHGTVPTREMKPFFHRKGAQASKRVRTLFSPRGQLMWGVEGWGAAEHRSGLVESALSGVLRHPVPGNLLPAADPH